MKAFIAILGIIAGIFLVLLFDNARKDKLYLEFKQVNTLMLFLSILLIVINIYVLIESLFLS